MKQTIKLFLALMGATLLSANALAETEAPSLVNYDVNGDGTINEGEKAYELKDADDLYWFRDFVNEGGDNVYANAFLANNIVVNENVLDENGNPNEGPFKEWAPIGNYDGNYTYYEGTFDGNGNTISGLYFSHEDNQYNMGLFGNIKKATIKNLGVIDSYFYCKCNWALGGICGYNDNGTIENCYSTGSVSGDKCVGGVCGDNNGTTTNCYSTSRVSGDSDVGGVCGYSWGTIANCYNLYGNAVGYNGVPVVKVENKTQAQFNNGEVAYLLSQGCEIYETTYSGDVWGQDLSKENSLPELYADKVYKNGEDYENSIDGFLADNEYEQPHFKDNYYQISKPGHLYWLADYVKNSSDNYVTVNAVLVNDIVVNENLLSSLEFDEDGNVTNASDLDLTEWFPIGYGQESPYVYYVGTFDGKGYTISGLYFNDENQDFVGLFGCNQGTIQNVGVVDSYFKGHHYIGGVCGANVSVITNCYNTANVSGYQFVGGVSGANYNGTITNCYNTGSVKGSGDNVGGVCGENAEGKIENCYNTGEISGTENIGGVSGYNYNGTITNCYNTGSVKGSDNEVGGVCGENNGTITNCYNIGSVKGSGDYVGGMCGYNYNGPITNCYNTGSVKGSGDHVGGMCGYNNGTIENCYDFKVDGGTMGEYSIVVDNNKITLPADVTLVGKAFEGWYENDNYEGSAIVSEDAGFEVHTLYAKYPAPTQITADNYDDYNLTEDYIGYYAIGDAYELYWFANYVNKGGENAKINGVLVDNIVVNENVLVNRALNTNAETVANFREWFPIGYFYTGGKDYVYYKGTFDGNGKTVSGLYFNDPNTDLDGVGLFGNIGSPAVIKNVGVIDSYFNGGNDIASVCGFNDGGTIENCYNTSVVSGDNGVGGVCGCNYGTIENCYNTGEVSSNSEYVGGVCGSNDGGTIENCYDFKLNGGTLGEYSIVINEGSIALPADVTLVGKAFEGWYENDNYEGSAIVSEDAGFEVHTLYAKWVEPSGPTAIKAVETENNKTIKTIKDGQIVIIRNGVMYDMQGRKL